MTTKAIATTTRKSNSGSTRTPNATPVPPECDGCRLKGRSPALRPIPPRTVCRASPFPPGLGPNATDVPMIVEASAKKARRQRTRRSALAPLIPCRRCDTSIGPHDGRRKCRRSQAFTQTNSRAACGLQVARPDASRRRRCTSRHADPPCGRPGADLCRGRRSRTPALDPCPRLVPAHAPPSAMLAILSSWRRGLVRCRLLGRCTIGRDRLRRSFVASGTEDADATPWPARGAISGRPLF